MGHKLYEFKTFVFTVKMAKSQKKRILKSNAPPLVLFLTVPNTGHWGVGFKKPTAVGFEIPTSPAFRVGWHACPAY